MLRVPGPSPWRWERANRMKWSRLVAGAQLIALAVVASGCFLVETGGGQDPISVSVEDGALSVAVCTDVSATGLYVEAAASQEDVVRILTKMQGQMEWNPSGVGLWIPAE